MQNILSALKTNLRPSFSNKHRKMFFFFSILFAFFFLLLTLIVRADILRHFDFNMTVRIQDKVPVKFDDFFSLLSVVGRFETSIVILLLILFIRRKILGLVAFGLFGLAHIIEIIGKSFLSQPGPPHMFLRTKELASEFPGLFVHTDASYPSGHALRVIFLSTIVIFILLKSKKLPTYFRYFLIAATTIYCFLMVFSRVSLGEHWTTDVVGGSFLGLSFAFFSLFFL